MERVSSFLENSRLRSLFGRLHARPPWLALAISLAVVFAIRCWSLLPHYDMGCDIANYLGTANILFGQDPTGFGLDRPPLIALPLRVFTLAFGDMTGVKLLGILLSVALGVPFYLLARRIHNRWLASLLTLLFVLTPAYSDMLTWGYLTMFGLLFGLLTLHCFLRLLDKPSRLNVFFTGLFASLVVGFHQLSLAFFVPFFLLLIIALFAFDRQALLKNYMAVLAAVAISLILSLPYFPVYLHMLQMQAPAVSNRTLSLTPTFAPWILGVFLSLPLVVVALRWTWLRNRGIAITAGVLLAYSLALTLFLFPPPFLELGRRAHYFMYPAIWILTGAVLSHLWSWQHATAPDLGRLASRTVAAILMVILLSGSLTLSQLKLDRGQEAFGYLDESRWETVAWVKSNTPPAASIVVYPEPLGWWVRAEAGRNTACVTDKDIAPYTFLRERSLLAERILSRNQGLENGSLRLATTYPYGDAPGQPVLSVHLSGCYQDILAFDDSSTLLSMAGEGTASLAHDSQKEFSVTGDRDSMTMTTRYLMDGAEVQQTTVLDRGSQTSVISYRVWADAGRVTRLDFPLSFGLQPESVSIAPDYRCIELVQAGKSGTDRVVTRITLSVDGATVQETALHQDRLCFSFNIESDMSTVTFSFEIGGPELAPQGHVTHYDVRRIVADPSLEHLPSIDYLLVDLNPNPRLASSIPWETEQWLNACPYYRLVYARGDMRVYEVDTSLLP